MVIESASDPELKAEGEWIDGRQGFGPAGAPTGFDVRRLAYAGARVIESLQSTFRRVSGNVDARFWYTRRMPNFPWFCLTGVVANGELRPDGRFEEHETFLIGETRVVVPSRSGYLFCFANDAWQTYENNRGSIMLTVGGGPLDAEEEISERSPPKRCP